MTTDFEVGDDVIIDGMTRARVISLRDFDGIYRVVDEGNDPEDWYWVYENNIIRITELTNDSVERPSHYREGMPQGIEVIDVIRAQDAGFEHANVLKYILRWKYKGTPVEDLKKARQYLDWLIDKESDK